MLIAVAGGTGALGREGRETRGAGPRGPRAVALGTERVDLPGAGLDVALDGVDAVVDAANAPPPRARREALVEGTRRLLEAGPAPASRTTWRSRSSASTACAPATTR